MSDEGLLFAPRAEGEDPRPIKLANDILALIRKSDVYSDDDILSTVASVLALLAKLSGVSPENLVRNVAATAGVQLEILGVINRGEGGEPAS